MHHLVHHMFTSCIAGLIALVQLKIPSHAPAANLPYVFNLLMKVLDCWCRPGSDGDVTP